MRGYRFYEELENKNRKAEKSKGTVVALMLQKVNGRWEVIWIPNKHPIAEAVAAIFNHPNSDVTSCAVSMEYLWEQCRRISEDKARSIHPALFKYLEG